MIKNFKTVSEVEELMPLIKESLQAGQSVRFYPKGISMMPMLRQEIDSVLLSPVRGKLKKYDVAFFQRENGKYVLHRIVSANDTYTFIGDNQFEFEEGICHNQIFAVVTAFYRGDKKVSADNMFYQIYCRVWHWSRSARHFCRRAINWIKRRVKRVLHI